MKRLWQKRTSKPVGAAGPSHVLPSFNFGPPLSTQMEEIRFILPPAAGLLHVPVEIMARIFRHLDPQEHIGLGLVCRQLNWAVLHAAYDVTGSLRLVEDDTDYLFLRSLRVSLFKPPLTSIHITISSTSANAEEKVASLARLVEQMPFVGAVSVVLCDIYALTGWVSRDLPHLIAAVCSRCGAVTVRTDGTGLFAAARWGCDLLDPSAPVFNLKVVQRSPMDLPPPAPHPTPFLRRLLQLPWLEPTPTPAPGTTKSADIRVGKLFNTWLARDTLAALTAHAFTRLALRGINLGTDIWEELLPALVLPALTELTVAACNVPFAALAAFIAAHRALAALDLAGYRAWRPHERLPQDALTRLTVLAVPVECAAAQHRAFPRLRTLTLALHASSGVPRTHDLAAAERALAPAAKDILRPGLAVALQASFPGAPAWRAEPAWLAAPVGAPGHVLRAVPRLELLVGGALDARDWDAVPQWAALFPALREVSVAALYESESGRAEEGLAPGAAAARARAILAACPGLEVVEVDGEVCRAVLS